MKNNHRPHGLLDASLLTDIPPFSKLDSEQIQEILDHASSRRFAGGAAIFQQGQDAERFYMLLDGYVRVVRMSVQGERVITLHVPNGEFFGIAKAIGRTTYPATVYAASESIALSWPSGLWTEFADKFDGFSTETYKVIGHRMEEMNTLILELSTLQVEQRIANAILRMVNQNGRKVDIGIEIDFPITRQDLSEMTGTTLHTVSRTLSGWEKKGIIQSQRRHITVCEPHQLVVLSNSRVTG